jgi:hypothetical protein
MVSAEGSTSIYIDGKFDKIAQFSLLPIGKEPSGRLVVGNSPDGTHPWNGSFRPRVYNQALRNEEVGIITMPGGTTCLPNHRQPSSGSSGVVSPNIPAALYLSTSAPGC